LPTNNGHNKRTIIIVSAILLAAFIGVFAISIGKLTADGGSSALTAGSDTDPAENDRKEMSLSSGVPTGSIVKMVSALLIVILSIYFCVFLLKKFMSRGYGGARKDRLLEVIESTYVGPKKTVSLVRVADRSVLIGVTDQSISVLTELDSEKTASLVSVDVQVEESAGFAGFLRSASARIKEIGTKRNTALLEN
jgi:flagellar protein FliO/FliZ